jgi:hypothetical protein
MSQALEGKMKKSLLKHSERRRWLIAVLLLGTAISLQGVPNIVNFQGTLTDTMGTPITGTQSMQFYLYEDSTGGIPLWAETHSSVEVTDGLFRVQLGWMNPLDPNTFDGSTLWLGVQVSPDVEPFTQRQPLITVPYAFRTSKAGTAEYVSSLQTPLHVTNSVPGTALLWATNSTTTGTGIRGDNSPAGTRGILGGGNYGVWGRGTTDNQGYLGHDDYGVYGFHNNENYGYLGGTNYGVKGTQEEGNYGYLGHVDYGAYGFHATDNWGCLGSLYVGVYGQHELGNRGYLGGDSIAVYGKDSVGTGYAAYFDGKAKLMGELSTGEEYTGFDVNFWGADYDDRMFWDQCKSAFRAGHGAADYWADENVGTFSFGAGSNTVASGDRSVALGSSTIASGWCATALGALTEANGDHSTAIGFFSDANGESSVSIGERNIASGECSVVGGGQYNRTRGLFSTVSGGGGEFVADSNSAIGDYATIGGGRQNTASEQYSTVSGGRSNTNDGRYTTIGGGYGNTSSGWYSIIGGGYVNTCSGDRSTIGGGDTNEASAWASTVGGGSLNAASGYFATVAGGRYNKARGDYSVVAGGGGPAMYDSNSADGAYSTIPGGLLNYARGDYSFAAGCGAQAWHTGSFVWSDSCSWMNTFSSSAKNQFNVRASGGVRFFTNLTQSTGVTLNANDSTWNSVCDSIMKTNIRAVDIQEMLDKVTQLPIKRWTFKRGDPSVEHISPMAQDFWNLFHVGSDSLKISNLDPSGIALAAIQQLHKENQQLKAELNELRNLVENLLAQQKNPDGIETSPRHLSQICRE